MIYCISLLENFSQAILASAISRSQDTEAYLAVLYAAIRKHGVPEVLVSDNGGVFRSHDAMRIYKVLGIQKVEIEKRQAWHSYIESNFNAQRGQRTEKADLFYYPSHPVHPLLLIGLFRPTPLAEPAAWPARGQRLAIY